MFRLSSIYFFLMMFASGAFAQEQAPLPLFSVRNINNKIIVSWVNNYAKPVATLNIQRSYDSLKNYTTIGSVLSAQSRENGYADANFPYNKMFYRIFVAFEGGSYIITPPQRPIKDTTGNVNIVSEKYPWLADPNAPKAAPASSTTVFVAKDNNVVIHLTDYASKKYSIKFFDEAEKMIFELTRLQEEYLILEKVNFKRTGWFRFELYEGGTLRETNKFQIQKDAKKL